jgi:hypothetical protein
MVSTADVIFGADYNAVVAKVTQVLGSGSPFGPGTGSPDYGYNQALTSSLVSVSSVITANQFQLLADDVNKCNKHQTNSDFSGYSASYQVVGATIFAANLNTLDSVINTCITNRTTVSASQLTSTSLANNSRATSWGSGGSSITSTGTFTFSSAADIQYYFNQGGKLVFQGFFTSPTASTQDQTWNTLLGAFTYTLDISTFVGLTGTPTTRYSASSITAPYTANTIDLKLSVSGAVITYTVTYTDGHVALGDGPDTVSATTGFSITGFRASGAFDGVNPTTTSPTL